MLESLKRQFFPRKPLRFEVASYSDIGGRDNLEDAFGFHQPSPNRGCWVIADGVGGQGAGEVAARLAVETVMADCKVDDRCTGDRVRALIDSAHQAVAAARQPNESTADMASTIVVLLVDGDKAVWGHVGDSRLYHFRNGKILSRTEDQSVGQLMVARGALTAADLRQFERRNVLLHALGQSQAPEIAIRGPVKLEAGDGILLCTDGVWELAADADLLQTSQGSSARSWMDKLVARLTESVERERLAGHQADNLTAVVLRSLDQ